MKKILLYTFSCLSFLVFSQSCSAASSPEEMKTIQITWEEFNELKTSLVTQEEELTEALSLIQKAQNSLNQSTEELTSSQIELETLKNSLEAAQNELMKQKEETKTLKTILIEQKQELNTASILIKEANISLEESKKEIAREIEKHKKTEKRLKNQRIFWQFLSGILTGVVITRV